MLQVATYLEMFGATNQFLPGLEAERERERERERESGRADGEENG